MVAQAMDLVGKAFGRHGSPRDDLDLLAVAQLFVWCSVCLAVERLEVAVLGARGRDVHEGMAPDRENELVPEKGRGRRARLPGPVVDQMTPPCPALRTGG